MTTAAQPKPKLTLKDTSDLLLDLDRWIEDNIDAIELNGGALPDDLALMLDEVEGSRLKKAEAIAAKLEQLAANAASAKAMKDRAARREKVWGNVIASIKNYVLRELARTGQDRIVAPTVTLRRQLNSAPSVECSLSPEALLDVYDSGQSPLSKYMTLRREVKLDSRAIAAAYTARHEELETEAAILTEHDLVHQAEYGGPVIPIDQARSTYIADNLRAEFPTITVTRGQHLRVD